uniref:Putative ovule protein n=2 Tax=Solanum chacoense TaxID=4108 RepID=A0A0V0IWQ6_SOLCH
MSTNLELVPPPLVPPTGSNKNIPEQVSMSTNSELVPPPPVPPTRSNEIIPEQVSMSTNSDLGPPPPAQPLGSINDTPSLIPCDEEDDQRETNLKVNPLSRLETPKQTPSSQNQMPEKSKRVLTDEVQSVLVSRISSGTTTSVDDMVNFANGAFSTLNWIGDDYGSFYQDVKNMISYKYDLFIAERDGDVCSVSELEKQHLDAVLRAYNIEKEIERTQAKQEKDKEKKEKSKKLIEDVREMIQQLKEVIPSLEQQVAVIEQDEKCMKDDEQKHRAAYRIAQDEVEKVSTQINEARAVQMDAERRRNEALQGIESTTRRLQSYVEER